MLNAAEGTLIRTIQTGYRMIKRLALARWSGEPMAFATTKVSFGTWAVRIWNLRTATEIDTAKAYQLTAGEEDKTLDGLALCEQAERLRFAFASQYRKVMVADFEESRREPRYRAFYTWHMPEAASEYVSALAAGPCADMMILLVAGTVDGDLVTWDFLSGDLQHSRMNVHVASITNIEFGRIDGQPVLISAAADGFIHCHTSTLEPLFHIHIGEALSAMRWIKPNGLVVGSGRGVLAIKFAAAG